MMVSIVLKQQHTIKQIKTLLVTYDVDCCAAFCGPRHKHESRSDTRSAHDGVKGEGEGKCVCLQVEPNHSGNVISLDFIPAKTLHHPSCLIQNTHIHTAYNADTVCVQHHHSTSPKFSPYHAFPFVYFRVQYGSTTLHLLPRGVI